MSVKSRCFGILVISGLFLALVGCNGGGSSGSASGTLNLGVTDTPVDGAQSVVVAFTGVDVMGPDGQKSFSFASEQQVDLLKQQGSNSASLLTGATVAAGNYQWIRLDIDAAHSYIVTSTGAQYPLTIPSGNETGLKLVSGFTVAQGSAANFVIDFNLRQSITQSNAGGSTSYVLTPALRLVNMQQVGTVSGSVASTLNVGGSLITAATCSPAVYVYSGSVSVLGGFHASVSGATAPLTSASVSLDNTTGAYTYTVGFLAPGTYTLAVTCAAADTLGATSLAFSAAQSATVTANSTSTVSF